MPWFAMPSPTIPGNPDVEGRAPLRRAADIRTAILNLARSGRVSPAVILKTLTAPSGLPRKKVQEAIRALVAEGELIYTCEHGGNWLELSYDRPVRVSGRLVLTPPEKRPAVLPGDVVIHISAGAAFGAGRHPTTRIALRGIEQALDHPALRLSAPDTTVLDIGTGSGVLVIAAVKLGIRTGLGIDLDPCALREARTNVRLNGLDDRVTISDSQVEDVQGTFTLIAANLRPPTLLRLAPSIAGRARPDGMLVLSGIRAWEQRGTLGAFRGLAFECEWSQEEEEWVGLVLKKNG